MLFNQTESSYQIAAIVIDLCFLWVFFNTENGRVFWGLLVFFPCTIHGFFSSFSDILVLGIF